MLSKRWLPTWLASAKPDLRKGSSKRLANLFAALRLYATMILDSNVYGIGQALGVVITTLDNIFALNLDTYFRVTRAGNIFFMGWLSGRWIPMKELDLRKEEWHTLEDGNGCPLFIWPLFSIILSIYSLPGTKGKFAWKNKTVRDTGRLILALCRSSRVIQTSSDPKLATITEKTKSSLETFNPSQLLTAINFLFGGRTAFRDRLRLNVAKCKMNMPASSGPNGKALWDAHLDSKAVMDDEVLLKNIESFCDVFELDKPLMTMYASISSVEGKQAEGEKPIHSRLHYIEELGGKTRVVAILDYWTQLVLTPLHDTIAECLREVPMDGTFNQDAVAERTRQETLTNTHGMHSLDLTAATDKLPVTLQEEILNVLCPDPKSGTVWRKLLTDRDFVLPSGGTVRYGTGQPMGAKSSFPMLALTHHIIVQLAAHDAKITDFINYVILGDDVVIYNAEVAEKYRLRMGLLGVPINETKSVVCAPGKSGAAEMCRRFYVDGYEMSSLPVKLIAKACENGTLCTSLHNELIKRGAFDAPSDVLSFVVALIDERSALEYLRYSNLPAEISSIQDPSPDRSAGANIQNWFSSYPLKEEDLFYVWRYTVAVEALKRLDSISRQAQVVSQVCQGNLVLVGPRVRAVDTLSVSKPTLERLSGIVKGLHHSHPAIEAAQEEVGRVTSLLAQLQSGDLSISAIALTTLVDRFRSPLLDTLGSPAEATSKVNRMMLERFLGNLERACSAGPSFTLSYTLLLTTLNRVWTVSAVLGKGFYLNSVPSRVLSDCNLANARIAALRNRLSMGQIKG